MNKPADIDGATWFPLAKNKWMLIDTDDVPLFEGKRLSVTKAGYAGWNARVNGKKTRLTAHRAVMRLIEGDGKVVDHINRNRLDNRKCNLRLCTAKQNSANKAPRCKSGFKGVAPHGKKWRANITINGVTSKLGVFLTAEEAAIAFDAAALKEYGDFAVLNFNTQTPNGEK